MADLNTTYESLLEELSVIRDERAMHTNTATRVGTAMIHMLQFSKASFDSLVDAIGELDFDTYWEEYTDPQTGKVSVKLKSQYEGAWTEGFLSGLGYGPGGSGGGVTLNNVLDGINNTTFPSATPSSAGQAIVWDGTKWTFGTAGGGTDLNAVWDSLEAEDNNKQIDISHLTNALAGYATQSWVQSQGYLTSLPSHNHDERYYISNGVIHLGNNSITPLTSFTETDPTVPSWAKAANKPSYGFSEITGSVAASQLPTMYWADIAISNQSNNNTSPQFGNLRLRPGNANYGSYLRFGDGNYCYLYEDTDDHLLIYANKGVKITTGTGYKLMWGDNTVATLADIDGMATKTWVTDNMMKKARLDTTANIDTLYDAGSYRFGATAQGTWPVASNYGQVLVVRGADDTVAQMFFPYVESKAYLRTGNPQNANNGYWRAWKELATTDGNVATATRLASNDTKTLFGNTYWSGGRPQNVGTSWSNTANLNYVDDITMKGVLIGVKAIEMNNNQNSYSTGNGGFIDFHYDASTDDYTSRIIEDQKGRLNFNGTAFVYKSNKSASVSDFPGGALNETTDWGAYSFRNVFTNNSLFENTLFLRQSIYMKNGFPIFMKNNAGADVAVLVMENNNVVLGSGAYTNAGVSTYIRGKAVNFQTADGANATTLVGHFDNTGNFYIDVAGKSLIMNDGTTTRNMMGINIPATHFHLCFGATGADWQTRIYGGGGDDKGIAFYQGTTLAAGISGGDHSLVSYYHIKLTNNNQSLYTRNTNGTAIDTVRLTSNNILYFGHGCSTNNHETRIYGGATAGIGFYCGSTEVARVHKDTARQGIRIGDALLSWDSTNNALMVQRFDGAAVNFYSLGGLSGLGFTAPQDSLEAFRIDYLTSTNISTQTIDVATKINLGPSNCYIQGSSGGNVTINAPFGLTLGSSNVIADPTGGLHASRFYLDSTRYIYLDGTTLKYYNGSQSKTIVLS